MRNILFYGGASLLSTIWARCWKERYNIFLGLNERQIEIDNTQSIQLCNDFNKIKEILNNKQISHVINCAGLTNVEDCEKNHELAFYLNGLMPGKIAKMTSELGIKLIHISTDHLFDGKSKNYTEEAKTMPLNIYSKSKLLGENEVIKNDKNALIIRTNFFGNGPHYKPSFSDRIISTLRQKKNILLFNNVYYTPISIEELASCVLMLINNNLSGIFNVAGNERITKYEFGLKIADLINESKDLVIPIDIEEKKDLTIRPKDMSLSNAKLFKAINPKITPLSNQIIDIINKPKIEINIVQ